MRGGERQEDGFQLLQLERQLEMPIGRLDRSHSCLRVVEGARILGRFLPKDCCLRALWHFSAFSDFISSFLSSVKLLFGKLS